MRCKNLTTYGLMAAHSRISNVPDPVLSFVLPCAHAASTTHSNVSHVQKKHDDAGMTAVRTSGHVHANDHESAAVMLVPKPHTAFSHSRRTSATI